MNGLKLLIILMASVTAMAATCPPTELVGFEDGMTENDKESYAHAKKRCAEIYPDSPCLKKFVKRGEQNYWAICGGSGEN